VGKAVGGEAAALRSQRIGVFLQAFRQHVDGVVERVAHLRGAAEGVAQDRLVAARAGGERQVQEVVAAGRDRLFAHQLAVDVDLERRGRGGESARRRQRAAQVVWIERILALQGEAEERAAAAEERATVDRVAGDPAAQI